MIFTTEKNIDSLIDLVGQGNVLVVKSKGDKGEFSVVDEKNLTTTIEPIVAHLKEQGFYKN